MRVLQHPALMSDAVIYDIGEELGPVYFITMNGVCDLALLCSVSLPPFKPNIYRVFF